MSTIVLKGPELPNIPWEERPYECHEVVWRSKKNPIITRDAVPEANSIFNSAVVPFEDGFAGVFRCDTTARVMGVDLRFGHRTTAMRNYVNLAVPTMPLLVADKRGAAETKIIAESCNSTQG
jgi:hypothetical protein